jgi:hypothetical protein
MGAYDLFGANKSAEFRRGCLGQPAKSWVWRRPWPG